MADENNAQAQAPAQGPQFMLQRIYLKDMSFEAPQGVEAFKQQWNPKIGQDINTTSTKVDDNHFEVVLKLTINVTMEDKTVFLVEVQQAGLFLVKDIEGQQLAQLLNTMCPQILFPYAREAVDNCALKGSFPALALPPINFDALFARAVAQQQAQQEAASETTN
ncbi:protein-export chaperone SecB [Marinagarivorans algicola]|uniref:protein-export chaperone SecB n=1 Tax=Marinagarivorans algicola TaxID=1513270 RepID=UPI0006B4C84D|nr:protein-export chaperone SecB [Marinagarivorans algicola]